MNRDSEFDRHVEAALAALRAAGYRFDPDAFIRNTAYARLIMVEPPAALKVDFVNDSAPRFGSTVTGSLFPRIDAIGNILSNKITALYRLEGKDVADLWAICRHESFGWSQVMAEANEKEIGMDAATVADLIRSFPEALFEAIRWRRRPDRTEFLADLQAIAADVFAVRENSLSG